MESMADDEIIYLDNNATTPLDPTVIEEMLPFLTKYYGNPSSGHAFAARARKAVDLARERLAALLGCAPSEIVFTSGGTESNNAVIHSALQFEPHGKHVVAKRRGTQRGLASLPGPRKARLRRDVSRRGSAGQCRSGRIGGRDSPRDCVCFDDVGKQRDRCAL